MADHNCGQNARAVKNIRTASSGDVELVASIIHCSFQDVAKRFSLTKENCPTNPSNCTADWIKADQERGVQYFVLECGEAAVGCVGLETDGHGQWHLKRLAVVPDYRRQGFGGSLVQYALEHGRQNGANEVGLGIIADHTELKEWYCRLGFTEVETRSFEHLPFRVTCMNRCLDPVD